MKTFMSILDRGYFPGNLKLRYEVLLIWCRKFKLA